MNVSPKARAHQRYLLRAEVHSRKEHCIGHNVDILSQQFQVPNALIRSEVKDFADVVPLQVLRHHVIRVIPDSRRVRSKCTQYPAHGPELPFSAFNDATNCVVKTVQCMLAKILHHPVVGST